MLVSGNYTLEAARFLSNDIAKILELEDHNYQKDYPYQTEAKVAHLQRAKVVYWDSVHIAENREDN